MISVVGMCMEGLDVQGDPAPGALVYLALGVPDVSPRRGACRYIVGFPMAVFAGDIQALRSTNCGRSLTTAQLTSTVGDGTLTVGLIGE